MKNKHRVRKSPRGQSDANQNVKFSYYSGANKGPERSGDKTKNGVLRARRQRSRLVVVLLVVVLLIVAVFALPVKYDPKIADSVTSPAKLSAAQSSEIISYSKQLMSSSVLNHTKLSFQKAAISSQLVKKFPALSAVEIHFSFFGGAPKLTVSLKDPSLIIQVSDGSYYALDENGRPYDKLTLSRAEAAGLPILREGGLATVDLGKQLIPSSYVSFISELTYQVKHSGKDIISIDLAVDGEELDATISGQKYKVKFNILGDARQQAGEYLAAQDYLQKHHITPKKYLDVRVEGKTFFK